MSERIRVAVICDAIGRAFAVSNEHHVTLPRDDWYASSGADEEATCEHHDTHFDRTLCACGAMHDYCNYCGKAFACPWDESQEGVEADRPEDLPVPANADKRYPELDGG